MNARGRKYWALRKWRFIIKYKDKFERLLFKEMPELRKFPSGCAYCADFVNRKHKCAGCPLVLPGRITCFEKQHPYQLDYINLDSSNSEPMLNLIKSVKVPSSVEEPYFKNMEIT